MWSCWDIFWMGWWVARSTWRKCEARKVRRSDDFVHSVFAIGWSCVPPSLCRFRFSDSLFSCLTCTKIDFCSFADVSAGRAFLESERGFCFPLIIKSSCFRCSFEVLWDVFSHALSIPHNLCRFLGFHQCRTRRRSGSDAMGQRLTCSWPVECWMMLDVGLLEHWSQVMEGERRSLPLGDCCKVNMVMMRVQSWYPICQ